MYVIKSDITLQHRAIRFYYDRRFRFVIYRAERKCSVSRQFKCYCETVLFRSPVRERYKRLSFKAAATIRNAAGQFTP